MKLYVLFIFALLSAVQISDAKESVIDINLRLTQSLYKHMSYVSEDTNFVISPLSVHFLLSLLGMGARGNTSDDILKALGLGAESNAVNPDKCMVGHPNPVDKESHNLTIANGVFLAKPVKFAKPFENGAQKCYSGRTGNLDLADRKKAAGVVNEWVRNITDGTIREIIRPESFNDTEQVVLVAVVYYATSFKIPFRRGKVRAANFDFFGQARKVTMMHFDDVELEYAECNATDSRLVKLPLMGPNANLVIMLPNKRRGYLDLERFPEKTFTTRQFETRRVNLQMPTFVIQTAVDLVAGTRALGIKTPFRPGVADLSGIAGAPGELYVSLMRQNSYFAVTDTGVKAAGSSFVGAVASLPARSSPVHDMIVNHACLVLIEINNIIVFAARLLDPAATV